MLGTQELPHQNNLRYQYQLRLMINVNFGQTEYNFWLMLKSFLTLPRPVLDFLNPKWDSSDSNGMHY